MRNAFPTGWTGEEIAVLLGFQEHDIPALIKSKLLKSIGNPIRNAVKYFAAVEIEAFARETKSGSIGQPKRCTSIGPARSIGKKMQEYPD